MATWEPHRSGGILERPDVPSQPGDRVVPTQAVNSGSAVVFRPGIVLAPTRTSCQAPPDVTSVSPWQEDSSYAPVGSRPLDVIAQVRFAGTGAMLVEVTPPVAVGEASREPAFGEMLSGIRAALGLSVSSLAEILKVSRPTIYGWLSGQQAPREANLRRLRAVWALARVWTESARGTLGADIHRRVTPDRYSLAELLREEELRIFILRRELRSLAEERASASAPSPLGQRLAAKHGIRQKPDAEEHLSFETGKRMSRE